MDPLTITAYSVPAVTAAGLIMSVLATVLMSALFAGIFSLAHAVITGPAFEQTPGTFDLRVDFGEYERAIASKPLSINWQEPEPYFEVRTEARRYIKANTYVVDFMK
jgi:hypothetical protein